MTPFDYFKSNFGPEICITNAACDYNRTGAQGQNTCQRYKAALIVQYI